MCDADWVNSIALRKEGIKHPSKVVTLERFHEQVCNKDDERREKAIEQAKQWTEAQR